MADRLDPKASELENAVLGHDSETAERLLEDSGGACQAIDLARRASKGPGRNNFNMNWSFTVDSTTGKQTVSLYRHGYSFAGADEFVTAWTQDRCKKQ